MTEESAVDNIDLIDIYPVEESASGKNAFYHFCHNRQQQVNYAVCLHTIRAINEGRIPKDQFTDCQRGYNRNDCYAKIMLAEEKKAGQALYFIPRKIITRQVKESSEGAVSSGKYDMNDPSYARGWAIGGGSGENAGKKPKIAKIVKPIKPKTAYIEASMADVLNVISAEEKANKAKPVQAETKPVQTQPAAVVDGKSKQTTSAIRPNKGESMADFIQRRAKEAMKK